jgi:ATP-dependent Clp protease ATP-binding subunit ClpB
MQEVDKLRFQIKELTDKGDFNKAGELQYGKLPEMEKRLKEAQAKKPARPRAPRTVAVPTAAHHGGRRGNCRSGEPCHRHPVAKMMQGERDKLLQMEDKLHERVIGQNEAIGAVANAIRRSRSGLSPTRTAPPVPSCSWAPRAWARPSCARRWRASCLTAKTT